MEQIKVFLDTNVVLDYFTGRMNDGNAETIVQIGQTREYVMCISTLTGINALYISKRMKGHLTMSSISELFNVLSVTGKQWENASGMPLEDPEDALQLACAIENDCKLLVSRDSHLLEYDIRFPKIMSPDEFLESILQ